MPQPKNILVVRLSSLGDVVMTLPAIYALKRGLSDPKIYWVCEGSSIGLLECIDFIDGVIKFPRYEIFNYFRTGRLIQAAKTLLSFVRLLRKEKFDLILDFHGILKTGIICALAKGERIIGFGKPYVKEFADLFYNEKVNGFDPFLHKVHRNMLIVKHLNIRETISEVPFTIPEKEREYIEDFFRRESFNGKVFAVNPFSSKKGLYKRWPLKYYRELIGEIQREFKASIILLWGTKEERIEAQMLKDGLGENVKISCPTTVPQLLALLSKVDMYIGGDSGITHVASLSGAPIVVIFGPSDERINSPFFGNVRIVKKNIGCNPCKNRNCKDRRCLWEITPKEVLEVVKSLDKEG
ncbi:MAG: glycosyltransferase family 9 protein [Desulfobacterota bacterium]|nr:glycosyltransferase family 9 protein [Thermodesulfobacteriota bacterium]MDW8001151.1 glycosyltransferase family 9 protein [Deltaproteobacteria bacterium]